MKSNGPVVWVDGETAHHLEFIVAAGLRLAHQKNAVVPPKVLEFARDVTIVAGHYRMTVSGASGANATSPAPESPVRVTLAAQEVADLAGISRNGVAEAARRGRLVGRQVGGRWQFDPTDVQKWLTRVEPE